MKRWVLWVAAACLAAFAVWAGRAGWYRHAAGMSSSNEKTDESGVFSRAKGAVGGAEEVAAAPTEPAQAGAGDTAEPKVGAKQGQKGGKLPRTDKWGPGMETEGEAGDEADRSKGEGREGTTMNPDPGGAGRSFGSGGVGGSAKGVKENGRDAEAAGEPEMPAVSAEEAERIFAANDAAASAARELRQEALKDEEANAEEEDRPPLWIVRSLDWDEETQEMEVSFKFGAVDGPRGGDSEAEETVEKGILVQRIPPAWEVQSCSPSADAFATGSRKLKWLFSGANVAGREVRLLATPSDGADPGDWDLAPTWFTCRWNGKACQVQPEIGTE